MKKFRNVLILLSLLVIIICLPTLLYAQPDPNGDPDAPIDGGLGILIAAGIGYGIKKRMDHRKKTSVDINEPA